MFTAARDCVCHQLPPTATHRDRRCYYWSLPRGGGGVLCVEQGKKATTYIVEEQAVPFPAREWLLAKQSDTDPTVYGVTLDPDGFRCTCRGFVCHGGAFRCCHTDALAALFEAGELDGGGADIGNVLREMCDDGSEARYEDEPGEPTVFELANTRYAGV